MTPEAAKQALGWFLRSYWTPIDPKRRLSDWEAASIFSLRGVAASCFPPSAETLPDRVFHVDCDGTVYEWRRDRDQL